MSEAVVRFPLLDLYYQQYLTDESSADFIRSVSRNYSSGSFERLAIVRWTVVPPSGNSGDRISGEF